MLINNIVKGFNCNLRCPRMYFELSHFEVKAPVKTLKNEDFL